MKFMLTTIIIVPSNLGGLDAVELKRLLDTAVAKGLKANSIVTLYDSFAFGS